MNTTKILIPILLSLSFTFTALAGEEKEKECEWCDEESIKLEIGYMAKKLLDMSGKDSYQVEVKSYMKPFIGICTKMLENGIELTCVTPGTQAEKNGLKTGDVVTRMNDKGLEQSGNLNKKKKQYFSVVNNMKTGDVIKMTLVRAGETIEIDVTVGALEHPGYRLTVTK